MATRRLQLLIFRVRAALEGTFAEFAEIAAGVVPASAIHARAAAALLEQVTDERVSRFAPRLAGARHALRPRTERKTMVVLARGETARQAASAASEVAAAAHRARAQLVVVDVSDSVSDDRGGTAAGVLAFPCDDPGVARQTGLAAVYSLAENGLDLLALGLAADAEPDPVQRAFLIGAVIGAASVHTPVVMGPSAALALPGVVATCPPAGDYVFLAAAQSDALLPGGLAEGGGVTVALALELLDGLARLLRES